MTREQRRSEYAAKLKDPRWQRKRLEILQRDEFTCQACGDSESTLHVHHRWYSDGEPWEIEERALLTLCETCHEAESGARRDADRELLQACRVAGFDASDVHTIAVAIERIGTLDPTEADILASGIAHALSDPRSLREAWFEMLAKRRPERPATSGE